ncbi:BrnT family toxin [Candidatus Poribacteria bacterium]|nr:BrnT family toxin [Candidatus Poribacteria bacterium]
MPQRIILFDWDDENEDHIARHRITPEEVEQCFFNSHIQTPKPNFPSRYYLYGQTDGGRYLFIVFDMIGNGIARPVTAKPMRQKERRFYQRHKRN